jgi:hypothetical protein
VLILIGVLLIEPALAQSRAETPSDNVRRRQAENDSKRSPYWDGFILKHQGNCVEAITKLAPLANRGFGYEDAQTALGECHLQLAGLDVSGGTAPTREAMFAAPDFTTGLKWIGKAARAGHFEAQAIMVSLYAAGLGPNEDVIEGAKWAHLYLTNYAHPWTAQAGSSANKERATGCRFMTINRRNCPKTRKTRNSHIRLLSNTHNKKGYFHETDSCCVYFCCLSFGPGFCRR